MEFSLVKGTRDYSFSEAIAFKSIVEKIEKVYQKYGFNPIITPIVEYYSTLANKYGEEGEKLMWRFKLPFSDKEYGLKYDQTVPLQRFISMHRPKLPFKRYQIDRAYRYDDPQHGRYREFVQADIDIVGSSSFLADVEVIDALSDALKEVGFEGLQIRIFDRRLWTKKLEELQVSEKAKEILTVIDKLDKISENEAREMLIRIVGSKSNEILGFLKSKEYEKYEEYANLTSIVSMLRNKDKAYIDPSVVRGLEYYSSTVFEINDGIHKITLAGGGRYDNFISIGKNGLPAVGGSIGVSRIYDIAKELGILKENIMSYSDLGLIIISKNAINYAYLVASKIRDLGYNLFMIDDVVSVLQGIETLSKLGINYGIIIGEKEKDSNTLTVRNLNSKIEENIRLEDLDLWLSTNFGKKEKD